jgi:hypothetical protein
MRTWKRIFDLPLHILNGLEDKKQQAIVLNVEEEAEQVLDVPERKTCRLCNAYFDTLQEQRDHFQSRPHIEKLQEPVGDEESEWQPSSDEDEEQVHKTHLPVHRFVSDRTSFIMYRCVYDDDQHSSPNILLKSLVQTTPIHWAVFMLSGGHFAGMIYDCRNNRVLFHKAVHRYTTRRKQGGSQSSRDSTGKKAKSAGANLRRANEMKLEQEVGQVLLGWKDELQACHRVLVHAPGKYNKQMLFGTEVLSRDDTRIRSIPFSVMKPTLTELQNVCDRLLCVQLISE